MSTIHLIFHAHLDPIWMWPWTSGLDEAINTARSACDRLDAHPDLFFSQGEAWTFHLIEQGDPALFKRVSAHVASGRWEVVNGWWTQPDCNHPSAIGLSRQISTGLSYIKSRFGISARCGFNPDSFGHCSILPEIMRDHGQDRYVFTRPQEHERTLPGRLFTWRSRPGGKAVTAFRIATSYNNNGSIDLIRHAQSQLPANCQHTMAMMGLGDHGGGPTERCIAYVREHLQDLPGTTIQFSTIGRFFDAVERDRVVLPVVEGELQYHAVGCYSVVRSVKTAVRRAEHALAVAETMATAREAPRIDEAWRAVCSHQFHDTLGGTALPSAYPFVLDELGGAAAVAETIREFAFRRELAALPEDRLPRMVVRNTQPTEVSGWHEIEPYLEGAWNGPWRLLDESGTEVPYQMMDPEPAISPDWGWSKRRVLVHLTIAAQGVRVLRLALDQPRAVIAPAVTLAGGVISNHEGVSVDCEGANVRLRLHGHTVCTPALLLVPDGTDTWSHGVDRYGDGGVSASFTQAVALDHGPFMASVRQSGVIGQSTVCLEWRVYARECSVELLLDVNFQDHDRVVKLVLPLPGLPSRIDGVPGDAIQRPNQGAERPLCEWTQLGNLGVVCPDVFAIDATSLRARLTLLRSPLMAHHDPHPGAPSRPQWSDQGQHRFRFRFLLQGSTPEVLAAQALAWQRPPLVADVTRGMGPRDA